MGKISQQPQAASEHKSGQWKLKVNQQKNNNDDGNDNMENKLYKWTMYKKFNLQINLEMYFTTLFNFRNEF